MDNHRTLSVALLLSPIGIYFLYRGIRGLVTKEMYGNNPHASSVPLSAMGLATKSRPSVLSFAR